MSESSVTRRQFLNASGATAAGLTLANVAGCNVPPNTKNVACAPAGEITAHRKSKWLAEHGFWDYTTPGCGGMERFEKEDYIILLDDMAEAKMNSLVICPKWMTTGYRSSLPFLDQISDNPVIASDNELLRYAIAQAKKRNIKVWLLAVVNFFSPSTFGEFKHVSVDQIAITDHLSIPIGVYDSDTPVLAERASQICEELIELFDGIDGLVVELETDNIEMPHRIPLYNQWAKENNRPSFEKISHPFNPRGISMTAWRDYTTYRRLDLMKVIEKSVRAKGFRGDLAMICGTGGGKYERCAEVNLEMFTNTLSDWSTVHYEYTNAIHRYTKKDFGISLPKSLGITNFYLTRGVMTWSMRGLEPLTLEQNWQMDIEDFQLFKPHGVWWFGCGTKNEGYHTSLSILKSLGYRDGTEARRALLKKASIL